MTMQSLKQTRNSVSK